MYIFDQVKISQSENHPDGFSGVSDFATYYHIEIKSTADLNNTHIYDCWIKRANSHEPPDFIWRPRASVDAYDKRNWRFRNRESNPDIDPQIVFDIYMKSIE